MYLCGEHEAQLWANACKMPHVQSFSSTGLPLVIQRLLFACIIEHLNSVWDCLCQGSFWNIQEDLHHQIRHETWSLCDKTNISAYICENMITTSPSKSQTWFKFYIWLYYRTIGGGGRNIIQLSIKSFKINLNSIIFWSTLYAVNHHELKQYLLKFVTE